MRCRPDTKPLAPDDGQEDVTIMPATFVVMTDEEFDRAAAALARLLLPLLDEIEEDRESVRQRAA